MLELFMALWVIQFMILNLVLCMELQRYDASSSGLKEKELNLSAGYNFTKNLNTNIMYVNVDADEANGETDYNKYLASVEYKF